MDLIDDFADYLAEMHRTDATIETYIGALRQVDATLAEGLIYATEAELRTWLRTEGWAKATIKLRTAILRSFFLWACDPRRSPHLDFNPTLYLPVIRLPRRRPRPAPTDALGDALGRLRGDIRLCLLLAAYAGARCIEIAALDRHHVTQESILLHGKGDTSRNIPTHPKIWAEIRERPAGPLFRDAAGRRLTRRKVSRRLNWAFDRLGYPAITAHMWRHWFGTSAYAAEPDLLAVQELLGHASPNTTRTYVQTSQRQMSAAVAGLPTFSE